MATTAESGVEKQPNSEGEEEAAEQPPGFTIRSDGLTEFERLVYSVLEHLGDRELVRVLMTFMNQQGDKKKLDFVLRLIRNWDVPLVECNKSTDRSENLRKLANYLAGVGRYQDALPLYNQCLQFTPSERGDLLSMTHFNRAVTLFFLGHHAGSLADLDRVGGLDSGGSRVVDVLFWEAKNFWAERDFSHAKCKAEKALEIAQSSGDSVKVKKLATLLRKINKESLSSATKRDEEQDLVDVDGTQDSTTKATSISTFECVDDDGAGGQGGATESFPGKAQQEQNHGGSASRAFELKNGPHLGIQELSASLELRTNDKLGRHVVAAEDLKPGDVICIEKPYASILSIPFWETHCFSCHRRVVAPVPCLSCTQVLFCDEKCREDSRPVHELECGFIGNVASPQLANNGYLPFRVLLMPGLAGRLLASDSDIGARFYDDVIEKTMKSANDGGGEEEDGRALAQAKETLVSYLPDGGADPYLRMCSLLKHEESWEPRALLWLGMLTAYYVKLMEKTDFLGKALASIDLRKARRQ